MPKIWDGAVGWEKLSVKLVFTSHHTHTSKEHSHLFAKHVFNFSLARSWSCLIVRVVVARMNLIPFFYRENDINHPRNFHRRPLPYTIHHHQCQDIKRDLLTKIADLDGTEEPLSQTYKKHFFEFWSPRSSAERSIDEPRPSRKLPRKLSRKHKERTE